MSDKAQRYERKVRNPLPPAVDTGEVRRGRSTPPTNKIINFFMEFIDNVTPQSGRTYYNQMENFSPRTFWNKRDEQSARDFLSMYYQNAYNTALLNYQNEYNSPLQQMLRYQEAGINPYLAAQDAGNMGSAPGGAAPRGSSAVADSPAAMIQAVNGSIGQLNNVLKTAQNIYDYVNYGRPLQELSLNQGNEQLLNLGIQGNLLQEQARKAQAEADWSEYWNGREVGADYSPRARYMEESTHRISAQVEQLKSLVDVLYPSQKEANEARAALTMLQKEVLDGQKGAILQIDTGDPTRDSILQMVAFWLLNR